MNLEKLQLSKKDPSFIRHNWVLVSHLLRQLPWKEPVGTSLVVQRLRIHLAMQGASVPSLAGKLSQRATTGESVGHDERSQMRQRRWHRPQPNPAQQINKLVFFKRACKSTPNLAAGWKSWWSTQRAAGNSSLSIPKSSMLPAGEGGPSSRFCGLCSLPAKDRGSQSRHEPDLRGV